MKVVNYACEQRLSQTMKIIKCDETIENVKGLFADFINRDCSFCYFQNVE